ncbi:MAG: cysteine--tRNA ligase [Gammaproteobacteria bacterium]
MLKIYNTLTQKKEIFKPIDPKQIKIYVCGMTVYDYCHLGHARVMIAFDVIVRYLRTRGFNVHYIRNITDVDDKIIHRANEKNIPFSELTDYYIDAMHEDERALYILKPDHEPRATEFMAEMVELIQQLLDKKHAYVTDNGDVYFDVSTFSTYGELSHRDLEGLRVGARVEINEIKDDPLDFALWKSAKPHEPAWDAPWGRGRPGWHIECSAMSTKCLGNHFDIHGGGFDLQFPHHENEIAQSEAATGEKFVNYWMHVGFVQVNEEKMSKSLGNFFTIREILSEFKPEVVRYFMLTSHYRSPLNYSLDMLKQAGTSLSRLYQALRGFALKPVTLENNLYVQRFHDVMDDDFNTPEALAVLFDIMHEINRHKESDFEKAAELASLLHHLGGVLGILQSDPKIYLQSGVADDEAAHINGLIHAREKARQEKNWQEADRIRDLLTEMNVTLEDGAEGTSWRKM